MLGPFQFQKLDDFILITNDLGRFEFLTEKEFQELLDDKLDRDSALYHSLQEKYFTFSSSTHHYLEQTKYELRYSKSYLFQATSLHIFVVTNECNGACVYCQAQSGPGHGIRMGKETARKAVEIALQSPSPDLTFEFQGGEPLLNFPVIQEIVEYAKYLEPKRSIHFNLVSNLTYLTEDIALFLKKNGVSISTSLDGEENLHCKNRPLYNGDNSYQVLRKKTNMLRSLGIGFGAIETTTKDSLIHAASLIQSYMEFGIETIFLRPLTPLGKAAAYWNEIGYRPEEFVTFYESCLSEIIEANRRGFNIREGNATIFLSKMICGEGVNYMELRSPCGATIGQMAYYYDGNIYTCDEGRMLHEMGDDSFCIGNVYTDDYDMILNGKRPKVVCKHSILEDLPRCCDCVFQPYCGVCPVVNYALEKDLITHSFRNYKCTINRGMLKAIFQHLRKPDDAKILERWVIHDEK